MSAAQRRTSVLPKAKPWRRANSFRPSILNPKGFPEGFAFREMGAGYAGGIVSAAVDGIRVAEAVARG